MASMAPSDPPLAAAVRRIRRVARLLPGPSDTLVVVVPHADWIDLCNQLDDMPRCDHNRERGAYFGSLHKRTRRATSAAVSSVGAVTEVIVLDS